MRSFLFCVIYLIDVRLRYIEFYMNRGRSENVGKRAGSIRSEFLQKIQEDDKYAHGMLEDILGKAVPLRDGVKISTYAAFSNVSHSKSVRFSFGKEEIDSNSLQLSRGVRGDSKGPIKPALLNKNRSVLSRDEYGLNENKENGERGVNFSNSKNNFLSKNVSLQKRFVMGKKEETENSELIQDSKSFKRSLTDVKKKTAKKFDPDIEQELEEIIESASKNLIMGKRRHSHQSLSIIQQSSINQDISENSSDKQSLSEDPDINCSKRNEKTVKPMKEKHKDNQQNVKTQTQPVAVQQKSNSEASTNCDNLLLSHKMINGCDQSRGLVASSNENLVYDSSANDPKLSKKVTLNNGGNEGREKVKNVNFTIKEEPSCVEEFLTPNVSENKDSNYIEEEGIQTNEVKDAQIKLQGLKSKHKMFHEILKNGEENNSKKNMFRSQTSPLQMEPIVLMGFDGRQMSIQSPLKRNVNCLHPFKISENQEENCDQQSINNQECSESSYLKRKDAEDNENQSKVIDRTTDSLHQSKHTNTTCCILI